MTKLSDIIVKDTTANKPAAGIAGRLFYDLTTGIWQRDTGSAWEDCVPSDATPSQVFILTNATTDATPTELFTDGVSARLTLAAGYLYLFDALVVGAGASATVNGCYRLVGAVKRVGATSTLVGTVISTVVNESEAGLNAAATASGSNGRLLITVTGKAATAMKWLASVRTSAVALPA